MARRGAPGGNVLYHLAVLCSYPLAVSLVEWLRVLRRQLELLQARHVALQLQARRGALLF